MKGVAGIRFERRGALAQIVLDRPQALNALTHSMIVAMSEQLLAWAQDASVGAVLVKAVPGRAFCAGGDVRAVSDTYRRDGLETARGFFWDEYRLNWRIKHYPKPYIALLDGVTMGGGVGISVHGSHRLVTENAVLAMPETGIGMFPDVGGTHALSHVPKAAPSVGMFLGLTGTRLGPGDCLRLGYATHYVPAARAPELEDRLARLDTAALALRSGASLAAELSAFDRWDEPHGPVTSRLPLIESCFGASELEELLEALAREPTGWGGEQLSGLRAASPFAVCLTFAQLRRGIKLDFDAGLRLEYRMVQRVLAHGDFHEGVRALLVDKDRTPSWRDPSIEQVPRADVEGCFAPLADPADELALDWRSG